MLVPERRTLKSKPEKYLEEWTRKNRFFSAFEIPHQKLNGWKVWVWNDVKTNKILCIFIGDGVES